MQTQPGQGAPPYPPAQQFPPPQQPQRSGVPGWVIAVIVIAVVAFVLAPVVAVIAGFAFFARVAEDVVPLIQDEVREGNERAVRDGVTSIQAGVEAWAAEHRGRYPGATRVDQFGLTSGGGYPLVDPWPQNPLAGGAMTQGRGEGQYLYVRGPGGRSYQLTGYGTGGVPLITLP